MKLVVVTNCFPPNAIGGAELTAQTIAGVFRAEGHDVVFITLSTDLTIPSDSLDVRQLPMFNIYDPWREESVSVVKKVIWKLLDYFNFVMGFRLYFALLKEKPDVVFTHNLKGFSVSAWIAAKISGAKLFHVLHDYYLVCSRCSLERNGARCSKWCGSCKAYSTSKVFSAGLVDKFIGVSQFISNIHTQRLGVSKDKVVTIHNARIPNPQGQFAQSNPVTLKGAADRLKPGLFIFGYIGRIEAVKGIDLLFQAASELPGDFLIKIGGKESSKGYLDRLSAKYPNVKYEYLGFVKSSDFYQSVDCVIVPSMWDEPHPGVTYEPMEFKVPVIGSKVGGIPEVIQDELNGLLFEVGDAASLRSKMDKMMNDADFYSKCVRGTLSAQKFFDTNRIAEQYFSVVL